MFKIGDYLVCKQTCAMFNIKQNNVYYCYDVSASGYHRYPFLYTILDDNGNKFPAIPIWFEDDSVINEVN